MQLLRGHGSIIEATAAAGPLSRLTGRRDRSLIAGFRTRLAAIESRLTAVERRVGTGPEISELDDLIDQITSERQAAAEDQDYEQAAALRDRERRLLADKASRQHQWAATHPDLPCTGRDGARAQPGGAAAAGAPQPARPRAGGRGAG